LVSSHPRKKLVHLTERQQKPVSYAEVLGVK
jgi:hypothetical protein